MASANIVEVEDSAFDKEVMESEVPFWSTSGPPGAVPAGLFPPSLRKSPKTTKVPLRWGR